jgi:hypothetical protein
MSSLAESHSPVTSQDFEFAPDPFDFPDVVDRSWWLGYTLGRDGFQAEADESLTPYQRYCFGDGYEAGVREHESGVGA